MNVFLNILPTKGVNKMKNKLTHLIIASLISLSVVFSSTGISYAGTYVTKESTNVTTSATGFDEGPITQKDDHIEEISTFELYDPWKYLITISPLLEGAVVWGPEIDGLPHLEAGQKVHSAGVWLKLINNYADTIVKVRVVNTNGGGSMYAYTSLLNIPNSTSTNTITIDKGHNNEIFYIRTKSCEELGYPAGGQPPTLALLKVELGEQILLNPFIITYDCNQW